MPSQIYFENRLFTDFEKVEHVSSLKYQIASKHSILSEDLLVTINGRLVDDHYDLKSSKDVVRVWCKLVGGKGGFGSMLRAIGAQIEKTTNREACRDLSGRRLRDINEEKRLRKWLEGQEEREREAAERKLKKIEKLIAEPKIEVKMTPEYENERNELPKRVSAAVDAGWNAASSSTGGAKRKAEEVQSKAKKSKFWIDPDLSDCSSITEDEDEQDEQELSSLVPMVSTDSKEVIVD